MGSIVVSDFGGNHFHNTMFGGGSAHQHAQDSPARSSPAATAAATATATAADVAMPDSGAPPCNTTPAQRAHQQTTAAATSPSPRFRTHSRPPSSATPPPPAHLSPARSLRSPADSPAPSPRRIKVKSLSHIQSFAVDDASPFSQTRALARRQRRDPADVGPQYEISEMPVSDIIEMVAGLLTKITTTNDRQHDHLHRQIPPPDGTAGLSQQTTSVLAFHGKNVPSISILSYLSRIHKYCPTTYEVFLSLLVYFDRMTERSLHRSVSSPSTAPPADAASTDTSQTTTRSTQAATPPPSGSLGKPHETPAQGSQPPSPPQQELDTDAYNLSHFFVVDSFNIHRLVIAGVTCASKFFSDVFYTNSRYAKVGGLPLVELNHLELQFLLLNDFRLAVPLEEMEAYGTMLVEFYAREVAEQHERQASGRF
ncbi:cyclin-like protein interacting with PHO85 [Coniothyrium glycines]